MASLLVGLAATALAPALSTRRSVLQHAVPFVVAVAPLRAFAADDQILSTVVEAGDAASPLAERGQTAVVDYTLWIGDFGGKRIDGNGGFKFRVGVGQVIAGWDQTVSQMHVGERRRVVIPSSLGYGPQGIGPIPGGAPLYFDIKLRGLEPTKAMLEAKAAAEAAARTPQQVEKEDKAAMMKRIRAERMEAESNAQSDEYRRLQSGVGTRSFGSTVSVQARPAAQ